MAELAPKERRIVLIDDKNIIDHGVHLTIPEENGEIIAHDLLELIIILLVVVEISNLKQLILYNDFGKYLYTVPIDFQIVHPDYGDNIDYYPSTKAYSSLKLFPVGMHPVLKQLGLFGREKHDATQLDLVYLQFVRTNLLKALDNLGFVEGFQHRSR
jgi:hypothetical protein